MVVNLNLVQTLEQAEIDLLNDRLSALENIVGNPMGIEVVRFGNAIAFSAKNIPGPSFNTVKGLRDVDEKHIETILKYYHKKEIPIRFEVAPALVSSNLLRYLRDLGFYQSDFHSTLYTVLQQNQEETNEIVEIRRLKEDEFSLFAEIYTEGFQMPSFLKEAVAQNNSILYNRDGWTFYLGSLNGKPAGIGVLFMKNQVATLAAAATLPEYRNNGIQTALLKERMQKAIREDCELLVGHAKVSSISQNNMERVGMKIAYTKAIWVNQ